MTKNSKLKKRIRDRMTQTGETYCQVRDALVAERVKKHLTIANQVPCDHTTKAHLD